MMTAWNQQQIRNRQLLEQSPSLGAEITSQVLPVRVDIATTAELTREQIKQFAALEIETARTAILAVASLAKLKEVDHLGGGLDLISAMLMTLSVVDYEKKDFTIENAHASIGYYAALATLGFLDPQLVINRFRQSLSIPGHVSWVPGGAQMNGGRLGVMIPAAVGVALGKKAYHGDAAWMLCHCGDAGWISGQALNGFNAADLHHAPVTFVMHRNGIQLSGSNQQIMNKDPRPIIASLGVEILEIKSLHDFRALFGAYREAFALAQKGRPSLIYPTGYGVGRKPVDLTFLGEKYGILAETQAFAAKNNVPMDTKIWIPGALMSYRDVQPMLECVFLCNNLPGGKGHHDGHMGGRDVEAVLNNPMMTLAPSQKKILKTLRAQPPRTVVTRARPAPGTPNLVLPANVIQGIQLPGVGQKVSPRAGVQAGYGVLAQTFPQQMFVLDCDLAPSTKVDSARKVLARDHQFELSIEEQIAAIMANGLAVSTDKPQLVVFATFAAFFEGIAREGFEMWRYQRNLNGVNEGLNATLHLSHVGSCTGRDHFSGWSLNWVNLALDMLPYLDRFYAPADARSAFVAVRDLGARYGAHILAIPRDNLPILAKQDGSGPLWNADTPWEAVTTARTFAGARKAILALGATAFVAIEAAEKLAAAGQPVDVQIVNGLPLAAGTLENFCRKYPAGLVSIEDGLIGTPDSGLQGLAGLVASEATGHKVPTAQIGITDPRIAPSEGHMELWKHFGLTVEDLMAAVQRM